MSNDLDELEKNFNQFLNLEAEENPPLLHSGTKVLAHWTAQKYEFYPATIFCAVETTDRSQRYQVRWEDGDDTDQEVNRKDICLDILPQLDQLKIGDTVLFQQGNYQGPDGLAIRWHLGKITGIENGKFSGKHKYGANDGKWLGYSGYAETFEEYSLENLRLFVGSEPEPEQNLTQSELESQPNSVPAVLESTLQEFLAPNTQVMAHWSRQPYEFFPAKIVSCNINDYTYTV